MYVAEVIERGECFYCDVLDCLISKEACTNRYEAVADECRGCPIGEMNEEERREKTTKEDAMEATGEGKCGCGRASNHKGRCAFRRTGGANPNPAQKEVVKEKGAQPLSTDDAVQKIIAKYNDALDEAAQAMTALLTLREFGVKFEMPSRHVMSA